MAEKTIETVKLDILKDWDKNPNFMSDDSFRKLKNSLKEFGSVGLIIIDEDNRIIGGHHRAKALKELGLSEIEVHRIAGLSEEKKAELALALNAIHGNFVEDKLDKLLAELMRDFHIDLLAWEEITGVQINPNILTSPEFLSPEINAEEIPDIESVKIGGQRTGDRILRILSFGHYKARLSDEEYQHLEREYHSFIEQNKTDYGFISHLCNLGVYK